MDDNKTVHLADDDEDDRMLIKDAINEADAQVKVVEAETGAQLIENIKKEESIEDAIVVLDMNMPGMNGLETVEAIRADPDLTQVPTVMMSTSSNPDLARKAVAAGVDEFVTKPSSFRGLVDFAKRIFLRFFSRG